MREIKMIICIYESRLNIHFNVQWGIDGYIIELGGVYNRSMK